MFKRWVFTITLFSFILVMGLSHSASVHATVGSEQVLRYFEPASIGKPVEADDHGSWCSGAPEWADNISHGAYVYSLEFTDALLAEIDAIYASGGYVKISYAEDGSITTVGQGTGQLESRVKVQGIDEDFVSDRKWTGSNGTDDSFHRSMSYSLIDNAWRDVFKAMQDRQTAHITGYATGEARANGCEGADQAKVRWELTGDNVTKPGLYKVFPAASN